MCCALLLHCLMQDRVSADPDDPELQSLQQQLQLLGPVPRRLQLSHQQEMELWTWAEEEVAAGRVSTRLAVLIDSPAVCIWLPHHIILAQFVLMASTLQQQVPAFCCHTLCSVMVRRLVFTGRHGCSPA
jgi:hypothetical protein